MKATNIYKKLIKLGFKVDEGKYSYWDNITKISIDGCDLWIAKVDSANGSSWIVENFTMSEVLQAIELFKKVIEKNSNEYRNSYDMWIARDVDYGHVIL